jgi:hypothetical protein
MGGPPILGSRAADGVLARHSLLTDIGARRIDVIVVYKVDRLTRALAAEAVVGAVLIVPDEPRRECTAAEAQLVLTANLTAKPTTRLRTPWTGRHDGP